MKSAIFSIQPYFVFCIVARALGYDVKLRKEIEIRKRIPTAKDWNQKALIYCSKSKTSFNRIPKQHRSWVKQLLGKVVGEFYCDHISNLIPVSTSIDGVKYYLGLSDIGLKKTCLSQKELCEYGKGKNLYGCHIRDLKVYNTPKEITEFIRPFKYDGDGIICGTAEEMSDIAEWNCQTLFGEKYPDYSFENCDCKNCPKAKDFYRLKHPPESWCYVEAI